MHARQARGRIGNRQLQYADQSGVSASCTAVELRDRAISCQAGCPASLAVCPLPPLLRAAEHFKQRQDPKQAAPFWTVERIVQRTMLPPVLRLPDLLPDNNPVEKHPLSSIYWW